MFAVGCKVIQQEVFVTAKIYVLTERISAMFIATPISAA
jgi:hypothetical protein